MTKTQKRMRRLLPLLGELCAAGKKPNEIKEHPKFRKFHIRTIRRRISRLGLVDPERSRRRAECVRFTAKQHEEFVKFLEKNWALYAVTDLRLLWRKKYVPLGYPLPHLGTFMYWLRKLGYRLGEKEVYRTFNTEKRMAKQLQKLSAGNSLRAAEARANRLRENLARNKQILEQKNPPISSHCRTCSVTWAHVADFWENLRGALLLQECRFCRNDARRAGTARDSAARNSARHDRKLSLWLDRWNQIDKRELERSSNAGTSTDAIERKVCSGPCGRTLPLCVSYFKGEEHQTTDGESRTYYRSCCIACEDRLRMLKEARRKGLVVPEDKAELLKFLDS